MSESEEKCCEICYGSCENTYSCEICNRMYCENCNDEFVMCDSCGNIRCEDGCYNGRDCSCEKDNLYKEVRELREENKKLKEENNMLKERIRELELKT